MSVLETSAAKDELTKRNGVSLGTPVTEDEFFNHVMNGRISLSNPIWDGDGWSWSLSYIVSFVLP